MGDVCTFVFETNASSIVAVLGTSAVTASLANLTLSAEVVLNACYQNQSILQAISSAGLITTSIDFVSVANSTINGVDFNGISSFNLGFATFIMIDHPSHFHLILQAMLQRLLSISRKLALCHTPLSTQTQSP